MRCHLESLESLGIDLTSECVGKRMRALPTEVWVAGCLVVGLDAQRVLTPAVREAVAVSLETEYLFEDDERRTEPDMPTLIWPGGVWH